MEDNKVRYSDEELSEFRLIILEKVKKANTSDSAGYISKDSKRDDKKSKFKNSKKPVNSSSGTNKKSSKSKSNKKPLSTKIFKSN